MSLGRSFEFSQVGSDTVEGFFQSHLAVIGGL